MSPVFIVFSSVVIPIAIVLIFVIGSSDASVEPDLLVVAIAAISQGAFLLWKLTSNVIYKVLLISIYAPVIFVFLVYLYFGLVCKLYGECI